MNDPATIFPDPDRKPEFVRQGFDSIARRYDLLNDVMTAGMHRRWKKEAIRRLNLQPGMWVLDLCSGTGDLAVRAAQAVHPDGRVIALDFSPQMMAIGRARMRNSAWAESMDWIRADAGVLPFPENSFDGASVGFGLRNVRSIETVLGEVWRVLLPGAWFISLDTAPCEWRWLTPLYHGYMRFVVPRLGAWIAGERGMYSYLTASAAAFETPQELCTLLEQCGFVKTGFAFRPRIAGGAALVWGQKPE